jgi:hypothetical protein
VVVEFWEFLYRQLLCPSLPDDFDFRECRTCPVTAKAVLFLWCFHVAASVVWLADSTQFFSATSEFECFSFHAPLATSDCPYFVIPGPVMQFSQCRLTKIANHCCFSSADPSDKPF